MENIAQKIFDIEKRISYELTKQATMAIREENIFVSAFQKEARKQIAKVKSIIPRSLSENESEPLLRKLGLKWDFFFREIEKTIEIFLKKTGREQAENIENIAEKYLKNINSIQESFFKIDRQSIASTLDRVWTQDGISWRDRVRRITSSNRDAKKFKKIFKEGLNKGLGYYEILRKIKMSMAIDALKAQKIIHTEGQRIQNDIAIAAYSDLNKKGHVSGVEYTATLDMRTCVICSSYDRRQYFFEPEFGALNIVDAPVVPQHPFCRCFYSPISAWWQKNFGKDWIQSRASQFGYMTGGYEDFLRRAASEDSDWVQKHLGKFYEEWKNGRDIKTLEFSPTFTLSAYLISLDDDDDDDDGTENNEEDNKKEEEDREEERKKEEKKRKKENEDEDEKKSKKRKR